jgi:exosortase family protein XrtF
MKDLKPAIRFVIVFVVLYLVLNVLYGFWIKSYGNYPDPATEAVTHHTSVALNFLGEQITTMPTPGTASVSILTGMRSALKVYEGCNSINVMIVFVSFIFAFGGAARKIAWFIPLGIVLIYIFNLIRLVGLYYVAEYWHEYFYYVHKYAFTAFIYLLVLILWWWWIEKASNLTLKDLLKPDQK